MNTQSISECYGGSDWADPELYLQTTGVYNKLIKAGRDALIFSGADRIEFWNIPVPAEDGFIEPIEEESPTEFLPEACTYEGIPHCFPPEDYYQITWQGPVLAITSIHAKLKWYAKHGDEELTVYINEGTTE